MERPHGGRLTQRQSLCWLVPKSQGGRHKGLRWHGHWTAAEPATLLVLELSVSRAWGQPRRTGHGERGEPPGSQGPIPSQRVNASTPWCSHRLYGLGTGGLPFSGF